jgi:hypothetical protein
MNLPTILVILILAAVISAVIVHMIRKKKRCGFSCGCGSCPMHGDCGKKPGAS